MSRKQQAICHIFKSENTPTPFARHPEALNFPLLFSFLGVTTADTFDQWR
jgi:hypothetical protein